MMPRANHGWLVTSLVVALALANMSTGDAQAPQLTGTVETLSSSGTTYDYPAVSADGRQVAFISELQLDPGQVVSSTFHIWVRDRQLGTTVLVSKSTTGVGGNNRSQRPAISADGRFVAFSSSASNLVPGDTNDVDDIFVHDRDADGNGVFDEPGEAPLTRVSISSDGTQANCVSARPSISGTGRYVAFDSCATNWSEVGGKTLAVQDIFVHDRQTGTTAWVNPPTQSSTNGFNNHHSGDASISADARYVAFGSQATTQPQDLGDFGSSQIFVRDTCLGAPAGCAPATEWASPQIHVDFQPSDAFKPAISANGRFVAFESRSTVLVPGDTNEATDIFVFDRQTRGVTRVNINGAGEQALTIGPSTCSGSLHASISGNGHLVTFESCANNLVPDDNRAPNYQDVFVHNRDADGNGVPDEPGGFSTTLISRNPLGATADSSSLQPTISRNGNVVVFSSFSRDITPTAAPIGIFAWISANGSPVADAGPDQTVQLLDSIGTVVTLDGSASHDPDGHALTFTWTGPFDTLTGATISPTLAEGTHTITLTVDDGHGGTASDTVTVIVGDIVDLVLTASAESATADVGSQVIYSLTVTNNGPADATEVVVSTALPANVNFVRASAPCSAPPTGESGTVTCDLGSIGNGDLQTLVIIVTPTVAGPLTVSLSARARQPDVDLTNNSASVTVMVGAVPVVINITETITVTDAPGVRPSALLNVAEIITVQDIPNVLPSALVGITESIIVTDVGMPLPSAQLMVMENVTVTDAPQVQVSGNTPRGTGVVLRPLEQATGSSPVRLTFDEVTVSGETVLSIGILGPPPPPGFEHGSPPRYYDLSTTAAFTGRVEVCVTYAGTTFGGVPTLWHFENSAWSDITVRHDPAQQEICGDTLSLSPFAIFAPVTVVDTTPPALTLPPNITAIATSAAGAVVSYSATAADLVDGALTPACSPGSGATYRIGTTSVTCTATDAHGNTARGSFTVSVKLGLPLVTVGVSASGRDAAGRFYVDVSLTNQGNGHARNLRLTSLIFLTVSGGGTVTYNAALSGALPLHFGSIDAGAAGAPRRLYLNVPGRVTRFSIIELGTLDNVVGTRLPFIGVQIVTVPR